MRDETIQLFANYTLDLARGCLLRGGEEVHLRPQAYEVLKHLAENKGRLVGKDRLIEEVWRGRAVTDDALVQCLIEVRQALGEEGRRSIRTVRGRGYILDPSRGELSERIDVVKVLVEEEEVEDDVATPAHAPLASPLARVAGGWWALGRLAAGLLLLSLVAAVAYYFVRPDARTSSNTAGVGSLAVLPFKPIVPEGRDESLEMGMADTLIARLSSIGDVAVRPLGSVRKYGGLEQDPLVAGTELGVEAVLDGTIHRSADRVRVTARLVRVADGRQLWEGRFDERVSDIFSVQDSISEKVARALKPKLSSAEARGLARHDTENVEAYQLYLRGQYHALKRTLPETEKAISLFERAIALDPAYALAYVGLADAHFSKLASGLPPSELLPQAHAAAQRAIEIDDTLAAAHAELGFVVFWYRWDWDESERHLRRALELDPNAADAHVAYAHLLSNTGRHEEALAEARRARELDPLNLRINALEGQFLVHAGRPDEALSRLHDTLEMDPNYYLAHLYVSSAYTEKGMYAEAIAEARKASDISGARGALSRAFLGYALAKAGREAEARAVLDGMVRASAEQYISAYHIALVYNGLGDRDRALAWLERAYAQRAPGMVFLKVEPKWDDLRADPRFQDLLRRVGFAA